MVGDPVALTEQTAEDLLDLLYGSGAGETGAPAAARSGIERGQDERYRPRNVFLNTSGETVPGFGLLRVTGVQIDDDRFCLQINKPNVGTPDAGTGGDTPDDEPDDASASYVINGPRPVGAGQRGSYQDAADHFVLLTDLEGGTAGPGNDWTAVAGSIFNVVGQVKADAAKLALVTKCDGSTEPEPTEPNDPESPLNNNSCCKNGQLFVCPIESGIEWRVLCSAVDPPIDGEKSWKVEFFKAGTDETHTEILTLPCTSEVCQSVDLTSTEIDGTPIGVVNYGNNGSCCPCIPGSHVSATSFDSPAWRFVDGQAGRGGATDPAFSPVATGTSLTLRGGARHGSAVAGSETPGPDTISVGPGQVLVIEFTIDDFLLDLSSYSHPTGLTAYTPNFNLLSRIGGNNLTTRSLGFEVNLVSNRLVFEFDDRGLVAGPDWMPGMTFRIEASQRSASFWIDGVQLSTGTSAASCLPSEVSFSADVIPLAGFDPDRVAPSEVYLSNVSVRVENT